MARVLFTVTYSIEQQHRDEYLEMARHLKQLLDGNNGLQFSVFAPDAKQQPGVFQEVYIYPSEAAFEAADDIQNESWEKLMEKIYALAKDKKVSYSTMVEVA